MNLSSLLQRIDKTKNILDTRRPLAPEELKQLDDYFRIGLTYTSNALEGNTLTISETKIIIEDGLTVAGKPLKDCFEAVGHASAYDFMLSAARTDDLVFSEEMILTLHRLFYLKLDEENAGQYRDIQVFISGTDYIPPEAKDVAPLMQALIAELNEQRNTLHPIRLAAFAHRRLADVHPFVDGNGRTARLLMNLILINKGYQIISIPPILRREYIDAIITSRRKSNFEDFEIFIAECEIEAQKDYFRMFRIELPK